MNDPKSIERHISTPDVKDRRPRLAWLMVLTILGFTLFVAAAVPPTTLPESPPETPPTPPPGFPPGAPPTTQPTRQPGRFPGSLPLTPTLEKRFIQGVEKAHHKAIWDTKHAIRAKIVVTSEDQEYFNGTMLYDLRTGQVRMDMKDETTLIFDGQTAWVSPASSKFQSARFHLLTWPYFLAIPMKLGDPGVKLDITGPRMLGRIMCDTAMITFERNVGDTPDDWYRLYVNSRTRQVKGMAYIVTYGSSVRDENQEVHVITYDAYQNLDGVQLATIWTFHDFSETLGVAGKPKGRVELTDLEFITPQDDAFVKPQDCREDELPES